MLVGKGRFFTRYKEGSRGGTYTSTIHVSTLLVKDSRFPFKHTDPLLIEIVGGTMVITKQDEEPPL